MRQRVFWLGVILWSCISLSEISGVQENVLAVCQAEAAATVSAPVNTNEARQKKYTDEEAYLTAAVVSLASYNDTRSLLAREWLKESGWSVANHETVSAAAQGRFQIVRKKMVDGRQLSILSFPGTERKKDVAVDLKTHRVSFYGKTPEEFAAAAKSSHADYPLVHKGFDDYTRTALFTTKVPALGGITAGEFLAAELRQNPTEVLCFTGHSLGGAAATLAAARFADMGVSASQLRVITFGAPAVGNETFARRYGQRMHLTRIVMAGDPVTAVLQSLSPNFVQFGDRIEWQPNRNTERFAHQMVVYLDDALRLYYENMPAGTSGVLTNPLPKETTGGLYVAEPSFSLPMTLQEDQPYMKRSLQEAFSFQYTPVTLENETDSAKDLPALMRKARAAGCQKILLLHLAGEPIRTEEGEYRLILTEEIYDLSGHLLTMYSHSMTTHDLTPLEAASYLQFVSRGDRDTILLSGK